MQRPDPGEVGVLDPPCAWPTSQRSARKRARPRARSARRHIARSRPRPRGPTKAGPPQVGSPRAPSAPAPRDSPWSSPVLQQFLQLDDPLRRPQRLRREPPNMTAAWRAQPGRHRESPSGSRHPRAGENARSSPGAGRPGRARRAARCAGICRWRPGRRTAARRACPGVVGSLKAGHRAMARHGRHERGGQLLSTSPDLRCASSAVRAQQRIGNPQTPGPGDGAAPDTPLGTHRASNATQRQQTTRRAQYDPQPPACSQHDPLHPPDPNAVATPVGQSNRSGAG